MPQAQTNLGQRSLDPQEGFGFREQPRPEYLRAMDTAVEILNDPRNMWIGVGMPWLYHGTTAASAKNILQKGFDPKRTGAMWEHAFGPLKGRSGPGVYFSESPAGAKIWSTETGPEATEGMLRVFIPEKNIKSYTGLTLSPLQRSNLVQQARQLGFQAARFPDEVVVPDPASIPLKNIRPFTGNPNEASEAYLQRLLGAMSNEPY